MSYYGDSDDFANENEELEDYEEEPAENGGNAISQPPYMVRKTVQKHS